MSATEIPSLPGTWSYTTVGLSSPELTGFFHLTEDLRYVHIDQCQEMVSEKNPEGWMALRYYFSFEPDGILRIKPPRNDTDGWCHRYRFEGRKLWLRRDNSPMEWVCEKAPVDSIPPWFSGQLAKALARPWGDDLVALLTGRK